MIAYAIQIGLTTFYIHKQCFDDATRENVNNLTPDQMAATAKAFTEIPLEQIPDNAICHKPHCWRPIHRQE